MFYRYFFLSIGIHLAIILSFAITWQNSKLTGLHHAALTINSYVSPEITELFEVKIPKQKNETKVTQHHQLGLAVKNSPKLRAKSASSKPAMNRGDNIEKMLAIIHAAIKEKQIYPMEALYLEKEGRVTLSFMVLPNGRFENLSIKKSSGTPSLDKAAMLAALKASPLQNVREYLQVPQAYVIDIIFQFKG